MRLCIFLESVKLEKTAFRDSCVQKDRGKVPLGIWEPRTSGEQVVCDLALDDLRIHCNSQRTEKKKC